MAGAGWAITGAAVSALHVAPEAGLNTTALASGGQIGTNFRLWWQSVAVLGNGDFFGRKLSFTSGLSVACAVLSLGAVLVVVARGAGARLRLAADGAGAAGVHGFLVLVGRALERRVPAQRDSRWTSTPIATCSE